MKFYLPSLNNSAIMEQKITYPRDQKCPNTKNRNHLYFHDDQNN